MAKLLLREQLSKRLHGHMYQVPRNWAKQQKRKEQRQQAAEDKKMEDLQALSEDKIYERNPYSSDVVEY